MVKRKTDWKDMLDALRKEVAAPGSRQGESGSAAPRRSAQDETARVPTKPKRYVCVGLDFGTSSTKVVVRLLDSGPAYAVPLKGVSSPAGPFLAPTRLWMTSEGKLTLEKCGNGHWAEDMKVRLMEQPWSKDGVSGSVGDSARPVDLATAYIALLLRTVFSWMNEGVRPKLGQCDLVWSLNLGIPARDYDATTIRDAFATVARAGWQMSSDGRVISVKRASEVVEQARDPSFIPWGIGEGMINVVPEVAAGVATYARSRQRRRGPHLFVDVGATTLDASLFLLEETDEGMKYVFLAADVDSAHGALRLHHYRAGELGRLALRRVVEADPLLPIPATSRDCVPPSNEIDEIDIAFGDQCVVKVGGVVYKAKLKAPYDLSIADGDTSGSLEVLVSGGGFQLGLYQQMIKEVGRRAAPGGKQGLRIKPFKTHRIAKPRDLHADGLTVDGWQRLAVAYGLSYRYEDIGVFVPPSAVSDLLGTAAIVDIADRYVGSEHV